MNIGSTLDQCGSFVADCVQRSALSVQLLVPLPINDIVFSKSFPVLEAGTITVLKRLRYKSQHFFLEVVLVPLPINDIVFSRWCRVLEAGTTAVLKRLGYKSQDFFLVVALASS